MKKGDSGNVSKSATTSSSETKIHRNVNSQCNQKSRRVSSSILASKRAKSSHDLDTRKSASPSSNGKKVYPGEKSNNEDCPPSSNGQEELSPRRMQESLIRLRKNAVQPFAFLNNILDDESSDDCVPIRKSGLTEIDLQLAALTRRVRLNKSLLERTNERVKEINFLVERNAMAASRELNYGESGSELAKASGGDVADNESALNVACPGIMELKRTINVTKEMLTYVKKICNSEIEIKDLPEEWSQHMSAK